MGGEVLISFSCSRNVCFCVYFFVCFTSFIIPYRGGRKLALISVWKTDQADFTDWISFLPSNLMEEISSNTEALNVNT